MCQGSVDNVDYAMHSLWCGELCHRLFVSYLFSVDLKLLNIIVLSLI